MKTKQAGHTPGPWTYGPKNKDGHRFIFGADESTADDSESDEAVIAELWDASDSISEADARLIAAAPDLLAALKATIEAYAGNAGDRIRGRNIARAAIARAEGE